MPSKELSRDEQRAKDRQDELDRQQHVQDELEKFYKESREEAEKRLKESA